MVANFDVSPWVPISIGALVLTATFIRNQTRDPLLFVGAFFLYFAFGPVVSYLFNGPVYFGVVLSEIANASVVFALALLGLWAGSWVVQPKTDFDLSRWQYPAPRYLGALLALAGMLLWSLFLLLDYGPSVMGHSKIVKLVLVDSQVHRGYLLLQQCALSLYFVVRKIGLVRNVYYANAILYIIYCIIMSERDFFFVIFSILIFRILLDRVRIGAPPIFFAGFAACGATYLANFRADETGFGIFDVLNQGSLLFVDTYVLALFPSVIPFVYGKTYLYAVLSNVPKGLLHAVTSRLPDWMDEHNFSLMRWLVDDYSPGGASGYGFSLSAEAYLNFGLPGVIFVFMVLAIVHRLLTNRIDHHPFFAYQSVLYTIFLLYNIRGDSRSLISASMVGILFFAGIWFVGALWSRPQLVRRTAPGEGVWTS